MDRRTIFALVLSLVVFAAFTALQAKYAPKPAPKRPAPAATAAGDSADRKSVV